MADKPNNQISPPRVVPTGPKPTQHDREELTDMCKSFLKVQVPEDNIISFSRFSKYLPLFNKEAVEKMSEAEQKRLYGQYHRQFSLQHPIKVYGRSVPDPESFEGEVIYVPSEKSYHEVIHTIPPMFRQLRTLNELGSKAAGDIINSFLNMATKSDNPIAKAEYEKYGVVIETLVEKMNPPDAEAESNFAKAEKDLIAAGNDREEEGEAKKSQSGSDAMPDLFYW